MRSRSSSWLVLFFWAWSAAVAQENPRPREEKPASIDGSVTNSLTGEPLLRARVTLRGAATRETYSAVTDAEGKFTVASVPPGSYTFSAERVGFVMPGVDLFPRSVKLSPGDRKAGFQLKLTPMGAISGRVMDADGEPLEGVPVTAISNLGQGRPAITDDKGNFRIGALAPGKYRVFAKPIALPYPPEIRSDGTAEVHYRRTYYPNSPDEKSASRIEVAPGMEAGNIEIRPLPAPFVCVSGVVTGLAKGAEDVYVNAITDLSGGNGGGRVKADGTFQLWRLDPGKYRLVAMQRGPSRQGKPPLQSIPIEIEIAGSNIDKVELRFVPPADISGQVEFESEEARPRQPQAKPPGSQRASAPSGKEASSAAQQQRSRPMQVYLRAAEGFSAMPPPAKVAADGSFTLEEVSPNRYTVSVSWGPAYVRSMRYGQTEVEGDVLDLRSGALSGPLILRVSSAMASVSGTVRDDKGPAPGARVVLVVDGGDGRTPPRMASADGAGAYTLNVPPGTYKIVALDQNDVIPFQPGMGEDYEDAAEAIDLRARDKVTKDLKLRAPGGKQ